jgi:hypothetical protein
MRHANVLGAGAAKRKSLNPEDKMHTVMAEFKRGTLHSSSGEIVTDRNQAIAIGLSEQRRHGGGPPRRNANALWGTARKYAKGRKSKGKR